jgi:hypothetical protein
MSLVLIRFEDYYFFIQCEKTSTGPQDIQCSFTSL